MSLRLYAEDMVHGRSYLELDFDKAFFRIREQAVLGEMIRYVDPYGDTMFNQLQLRKLTEEIGATAERVPELAQDVHAIQDVIERILRNAGYLWISGD